MTDTAELREELATVEEEIRELEEAVNQLRGRADGPVDSAEQAQLLTMREEQESFLETLRNRREELLRRLDGA
jgi:chromosome segregation ATPase